MNADQLQELQARLKAKYREALTAAGLHPATGGNGLSACSGDMLLEGLPSLRQPPTISISPRA